MTKFITKTLAFFLVFILPAIGFAQALHQQSDRVEMADVLRSNGKIYAVVAVCLTILIGLFIYLFILDRKIKNFEKQNP